MYIGKEALRPFSLSPLEMFIKVFLYIYLSFIRKICKHCRCGPEDHDLTDDDDKDKHPMNLVFDGNHSIARELSSRLHRLNIEDPAVQSEIVTPENDLVIHRIVAENLVRKQQ